MSSARVRGPDGETNWIAITCKGAQMLCVQRAGEACPHGYEAATSLGHEGQASSFSYGANKYVATAQASSVHTYDGELLVKCRGTPAVDADGDGLDPRRFRQCLADESCDTGDHCEITQKGDLGRCRAGAR